MSLRKYKTKRVNNFIYRSRSNDRMRVPLSSNKQYMSRICLFEEYIFNLFMHFNSATDHSNSVKLPVFFQKTRLCFNDDLELEMSLMEKYYSKFRLLGKGEILELQDGFTGADKEVVDQVWIIKMEFFRALKEFQRSDILPQRSEIRLKRVERIAPKKKHDSDIQFRQRAKNFNIIELAIDSQENDHFSPKKKVTKFKMYVEKTFLGSSAEQPQKKIKPKMSKATLRLMNIRRLMKVDNPEVIKIRRFSLKKDPDISKLLLTSTNIISTTAFKLIPATKAHDENHDLHSLPLNNSRRKSIVESYLKRRFVTDIRLF